MKKAKIDIKFKWPLVGNQHIIDFLSKSITNEKVAQAYIFLGPEDLGKTTVANYFAKSLLCHGDSDIEPCKECDSCLQFKKPKETENESFQEIIHGDYYLLKKELDKKNISVEQVREFIRKLGMSSFLNSYKVGIIKDAQELSEGASNALLKTLEESKEKVVIILIASSVESLPQTIVSRSQVLNFYPVKFGIIYDYLVSEYKTSRSKAKNLSHLCLGRPALAVKFLEEDEFYNNYLDKVNIFLNLINQDINERLKGVESIIGAKAGGQESARQALSIVSVWQSLVRDLLLLEHGHNDLIQHDIVQAELESRKNKFNIKQLLNIFNILETGEEYLKANVNPKLVLENIAINI